MVREDPTVIPYSASPGQAAAKVAGGRRLEIAAYKNLTGTWPLPHAWLSPDKSGAFNRSMQHSARTHHALKTKAKITR
jgi:hypothetical protein